MRLALVNAERADAFLTEPQRHGEHGHQVFAARHLHLLVAAGGLHVLDLHRLAAAHDEAQQALAHRHRRLAEVSGPAAMTGPEVQPFTGFIQQLERANLSAHQGATLLGDRPQGVVEVQRGTDGLADVDE